MRTGHRVVGCLLVLTTSACSEGTAPATGSVRIQVATAGIDLDTDGYSVTVDNGTPQPLQGGSMVIGGLTPGLRAVKLGGTAMNCSSFPSVRLAGVVVNDTVDVAFDVTCAMLKGSVNVSLQLNGGQFDADGFTITVDQDTPRTGVRTFVFIDSVRVGTHTVRLGGLATNCTSSILERSVTVSYLAAASVSFQVSCSPVYADLRVQVASTGSDIDPDGYLVETNDDLPAVPIGVNAEVTLSREVGRTYFVELTNVAPNCSVSGGNPRSVPLVEGQTADIAFNISCTPTATLRVTIATSGTDLDPNGYQLKVQSGSTEYATAAALSGVIVVARLLPGEHSVRLEKVAANCDVTSPQVDTLIGGSTTDVTFDVACAMARQISLAKGVDRNYDLWLVPSHGTGETRLTTRDQSDVEPSWSPDGSKIAFRSERDGNWEIYVMSASGADQVRLTNSEAQDYGPRWSPLGNRIAYVSVVSGGQEIFLMDPDGKNVVNITNYTGVDDYPAWSPDGSKIAFRSVRGGASNIWVMDADGGNAKRLTTGTESDGHPAW